MTQNLTADDQGPPRDEAGEPLARLPPAVPDAGLRQAMRRARQDSAERAGILAEQRSARLGRLELLQEALKPLVAQIPAGADFFDVALLPGAVPRLFIDMIGFVEMGRDARLYRLLQDTRHGRTVLAESESLDAMVDAVTDYVARRLLERDRALASDVRRSPQSQENSHAGEPRAVPAAPPTRRRGGPPRYASRPPRRASGRGRFR